MENEQEKWILVTGGTGYIGSHTVLELLKCGKRVLIVDNLSTSDINNYYRLKVKYPDASLLFRKIDLRDKQSLSQLFEIYSFNTVIHFAGYKSVGESVRDPLKYYNNNLYSTMVLLEVMNKYGVKNIIFSSSASVYGIPECLPIPETHPLNPQSPYGKTKYFIEEILRDVAYSDSEFNCVILRYFNPVGADPSKILKENPKGKPENLMPYIVKVIRGEYPHLNIFGDDYQTKDGTGVRDYIHINDLALGHIAALKVFEKKDTNVHIYNLGTGTGYSVKELVNCMRKYSKKSIPTKIVDKRSGDVPICYADPNKAFEELGWKAEKDIHKMCQDSI